MPQLNDSDPDRLKLSKDSIKSRLETRANQGLIGNTLDVNLSIGLMLTVNNLKWMYEGKLKNQQNNANNAQNNANVNQAIDFSYKHGDLALTLGRPDAPDEQETYAGTLVGVASKDFIGQAAHAPDGYIAHWVYLPTPKQVGVVPNNVFETRTWTWGMSLSLGDVLISNDKYIPKVAVTFKTAGGGGTRASRARAAPACPVTRPPRRSGRECGR